MTITKEQLDELERKARDASEYPHGIGTRATLQLVAIARAALAWSEARNQDDHDAAAHALRDALKGTP